MLGGSPREGEEDEVVECQKAERAEPSCLFAEGPIGGRHAGQHDRDHEGQDQYRQEHVTGAGAEGQRGKYAGVICRLTESQVARLKDMLKRGVMRWRTRDGVNAHGGEFYIDTPEVVEAARKKWRLTDEQVAEYEARSEKVMDGDEPLSQHVYCVKVDPPKGANLDSWRPGPMPASVYDMGIDAP